MYHAKSVVPMWLAVLLTLSTAWAGGYSAHKYLISKGTGFAINGVLTGGEPLPRPSYDGMYPELAGSEDRVDKFYYTLTWVENPPLTQAEMSRLQLLELQAGDTPPQQLDPNLFAELQYLQKKAQLNLERPSEFDVEVYVIRKVLWEDGRDDYGYYGAPVHLTSYEVTIDDGYEPGVTYGGTCPGGTVAWEHTPRLLTVTEGNVSSLPKPWRRPWQPVAVRGTFKNHYTTKGVEPSPDPGSGSVTIRFRRHTGQFTAYGTMETERDGKFSLLTNASYHGDHRCDLAVPVAPTWISLINESTNNWASNPVDYTGLNLQYADYSDPKPEVEPLPDYDKVGDSPCPEPEVIEVPVVKEIIKEVPVEVIKEVIVEKIVEIPCDEMPHNERPKGNNGVGNGEDPQPPGNPPVNDGPGTGPGNPGNKGGAQKSHASDSKSCKK